VGSRLLLVPPAPPPRADPSHLLLVQIRTPDMGGKNSTTDFTQAVMKALK